MNKVWPPVPTTLVPADVKKPAGPQFPSPGQFLLGISIGIPADFIFEQLGFKALIKLRLIAIDDAFEGTYTNEGLQRGEIWAVYIVLGIFFLSLTPWSRTSRFAWVALIAHCLAGGIYSVIWSFLVNFSL